MSGADVDGCTVAVDRVESERATQPDAAAGRHIRVAAEEGVGRVLASGRTRCRRLQRTECGTERDPCSTLQERGQEVEQVACGVIGAQHQGVAGDVHSDTAHQIGDLPRQRVDPLAQRGAVGLQLDLAAVDVPAREPGLLDGCPRGVAALAGEPDDRSAGRVDPRARERVGELVAGERGELRELLPELGPFEVLIRGELQISLQRVDEFDREMRRLIRYARRGRRFGWIGLGGRGCGAEE